MREIDAIIRQSPLLYAAGNGSLSRMDIDVSSQTSAAGDFLKVLKSLINLIYEPVLVKHGKEEDKRVVHAVTLEVLLKNAQLLKDVWRQADASRSKSDSGRVSYSGRADDRTRQAAANRDVVDAGTSFSAMKMFEGVLKNPLSEDLLFYTYLLKVMCGKNRNKHAHNVFKMLD